MPPLIDVRHATRLAGLELNALAAAGALPALPFQGARVAPTATPIHDINGEILFYRVPLHGDATEGFTDIAAFPGFGDPLLRISHGFAWDEKALIGAAETAAKKLNPGFHADSSRFVAYSYPKIAVQFLIGDKEVAMIEIGSGTPIPPAKKRKTDEPPSYLERWSLIVEHPPMKAADGEKKLNAFLRHWNELVPIEKTPKSFSPEVIDPDAFKRHFENTLRIRIETKKVRYLPNNGGHTPCFDLFGQQTSVWCVGASVQMILAFYRYYYDQTEIAAALGLGTTTNPNGLPYSEDHKVVDVLENLSVGALDANMNTTPTFGEFCDEVRANRPLVSFIPGHSRAVAGFTDNDIFAWRPFHGLLVYDPWPPTTGVITEWENYDTMSYRRTFSAHVKHVAISAAAGVLVGEHW